MKKYLTMMLCLSLTGCSVFSPINNRPSSAYMLSSTPNQHAKKQTRAGTLLILTPETSPVYNTTQMAYTVKPYQVSYFGENHWAETPSQMLQPLVVQTLQNTHYFRAVVTPPYVGRYDYFLSTQILKLQQDFTRSPHVIELVVRAELVKVATNQVAAIKQFSIIEPIHEQTPYAGVLAANRATMKLLSQLSSFCTRNV